VAVKETGIDHTGVSRLRERNWQAQRGYDRTEEETTVESRSIKTECLEQFVLCGENSLRHVIREYLAHYHAERNHRGLGNVIPFPDRRLEAREGTLVKAERLGGLLNFYHRQAA
jgi:hypothetical protein